MAYSMKIKLFKNLVITVFFIGLLNLYSPISYAASGSSTNQVSTSAKSTAKKSKQSTSNNKKRSKKNQKSSKKNTKKSTQAKKTSKASSSISSLYVPAKLDNENPLLKNTDQLKISRKYFYEAKNAIKSGDLDKAREIKLKYLKNYPLNIWLDYWTLSVDPSADKYKKVKAFIKNSDHHELSNILKEKYIEYLASNGHYAKVLGLMQKKPYDDNIQMSKAQEAEQCRFYEAMWRIGKADMNAAIFAQKMYLQLREYPKACSGLIYIWGQKGYLTDKVRLEKFERAYISRYYTSTTRNLAGTLSSSAFAKRVNLLMDYYEHTEKVVTASAENNSVDTHKALVLAFLRFANLNPNDARPYFEDFILKHKLNDTEKLEITQIIAKGFLSRNSTLEQVTWVDKNLPAAMWSEEIKIMRLRRAIWFAQWQIVFDLYDHLSEQNRNQINWKYWKARAAKEIGKNDLAKTLMNRVAKDRSFFGFLAAQQLGKKMPFKHEHLSSNAKWPDTVINNQAAIRFFEFRALDDNNAQIEWREIAKYSSNDEAMMMAEWALSTGQIGYAISSVIAGKRWDALDYRFPKPFLDYYKKYSRTTNVPLSFLYGISRQESMLNPNIKSPVGAVGLMQLMPSTAKMVSRQNKWPYKNERDLVIPENNIRLGSAYLRDMLNKFDNNRILAAAAYNAGPSRIAIWKSKDGYNRDAAMYVENIPFEETRKYVQNVLLYDVIYKKLLTGIESPLLKKHETAYHY